MVTRDDIETFLDRLSADGATYRSVEFVGEAIAALSVDARFTVCNMAVEMGAKFGIMEADQKTLEWLKGRSQRTPRPTAADDGARYAEVREYDCVGLGPQVHWIGAREQLRVVFPAARDLGGERRRGPRVHHVGVGHEPAGHTTLGFGESVGHVARRIDREPLF